MSVFVRTDSANEAIEQRGFNAPNRVMVKQYVWTGGASEEVGNFIQPLTLSVPSVFGEASSGPITTARSTTSVGGGLGPFTYVWEILSVTPSVAVTINSPTSAGTTFTANFSGDVTASVKCTVTDSQGSTAFGTGSAEFLRGN